MAGPPNMAAITSSLERSFQNCSLSNNHHQQTTTTTSSSGSTITGGGVDEASHGEDTAEYNGNPTLELNSEASSLPYYWEQCLDLKTGEIYYINWRTGMKAMEDPRTTVGDYYYYYYYSDDDDESSCGDSEGSSSESSQQPSSSREQWSGNNNVVVQENCFHPLQQKNEQGHEDNNNSNGKVLVVAGCKSCLMYYMVPKQLEICPKGHQLLYFDRSENGSS